MQHPLMNLFNTTLPQNMGTHNQKYRTVHKSAETIQGRKLIKGGNYSRADTIRINTVSIHGSGLKSSLYISLIIGYFERMEIIVSHNLKIQTGPEKYLGPIMTLLPNA